MTTPAELYETHRELLDQAIEAAGTRDYWSAYPESPSKSVYGEDAAPAGEQAFRALLGADFPIEVPGATGTVATERSPYGIDLGIRYPEADPAALVAAARAAMPGWRAVGPQGRAGVAAEILRRINARSFEMAHAVQHTTGQAFVMAFQAGGPHAQDRAPRGGGVRARRDHPACRPPPPGSKPQRGGDPLRHGQDQHRRRPRGRAGDRLHHVPHLERLPRPVRQPGHRQPGDRQAAPAAPCCRWRSPCRSPARCSPRPASTRTW